MASCAPSLSAARSGATSFGGGLALYTPEGELVGAIGVSGDTSCTDHIVAWKVRHSLNLDSVPAGVNKKDAAAKGDDNVIHDIAPDANGHPQSKGGFGHPECDGTATDVAKNLPETHPVGPGK